MVHFSTRNHSQLKILGYPVGLDGPQYSRNRLIFNLCFVCIPSMRTVQYEPVVKKLAHYLISLEKECQFISNEKTKSELPGIMSKIRDQLNSVERSCNLPISNLNSSAKSNHLSNDVYPFIQLNLPLSILKWLVFALNLIRWKMKMFQFFCQVKALLCQVNGISQPNRQEQLMLHSLIN